MLPPAYFLLSIVCMAGLHLLVPVVRLLPTPWNLMGVVPLAAGVFLAALGNRLFAKHDTTIHPYAAASTLVVEGPFRLSRNPMYLGLVLALIGIAMLFGTLTPWIMVPVFALIIDRRFIRMEEAGLEDQFGEDYVAYRQRVRRWI